MDLRQTILHSARKEFLAHGFRDASMRRIAHSSHCSPGAIYTYFSSKDILFSELVAPIEKNFWQIFDAAANTDRIIVSSSLSLEEAIIKETELTIRMLDLFLEQREDFILLFFKADGSTLEGIVKRYNKAQERNAHSLFKKNELIEDDSLRKLIATLSSPFMKFALQVLSGDFPRKKIDKYVEIIVRFYCAGYNSIFHMWDTPPTAGGRIAQ